MRYWPVPSLTAVRTFSISAGLLASTVTPGSMAPEVSLTVPAITACAAALVGRSARKTQTARDPTKLRIWHLHVLVDNRPRESGANLLLCREKINRKDVEGGERQYVTRTRYFRVVVPSAGTDRLNCAAQASVFVYSCV